MAPTWKLNGVLSIPNWYISSQILLLLRIRMRVSKWIKSTDFRFKDSKKFQLNEETNWCGPDLLFVLIWSWALTVWSTLTGLDWESKRGLLLGFRNQALASSTVTQSICFIWGKWVRGGRWGVVNAIKRQSPRHHCCSPIQWPNARRASKSQLWQRMSNCSCKCFKSTVKSVHWGSLKAPSMRMTWAAAG